jgi:hypothetical protein
MTHTHAYLCPAPPPALQSALACLRAGEQILSSSAAERVRSSRAGAGVPAAPILSLGQAYALGTGAGGGLAVRRHRRDRSSRTGSSGSGRRREEGGGGGGSSASAGGRRGSSGGGRGGDERGSGGAAASPSSRSSGRRDRHSRQAAAGSVVWVVGCPAPVAAWQGVGWGGVELLPGSNRLFAGGGGGGVQQGAGPTPTADLLPAPSCAGLGRPPGAP